MMEEYGGDSGDEDFTPFPFTNIEEFCLKVESEPTTDFIVEGWLPYGEAYILCGVSDLGKSYLRFDMEISIASGRPWLGKFQTEQMPVYVLDFENPRKYVRKSMKETLCKARGISMGEIKDWHFITPKEQLLDRHHGFDVAATIHNIETIKKITKQDRGLFVVDSMVAAFGGLPEKTFEGEWDWKSHAVRETARRVQQVSHATGWGFLGVHHDDKKQNGPAGSREWMGAYDALLHYTGNPFSNKPRKLEFAGRQCPKPETIHVAMVDGVLEARGYGGTTTTSQKQPPLEFDRIVNLASTIVTEQPGLNLTRLRKEVQKQWPGLVGGEVPGNAKVQNAINEAAGNSEDSRLSCRLGGKTGKAKLFTTG